MCDLFYNAVDINYKKLYGAVASWPKIYPIKCGSSDRLFFRSVKIPSCINSIWLGSWNCKEILPRLSSLFNTFLKEEEEEGVVAFVRVIHFPVILSVSKAIGLERNWLGKTENELLFLRQNKDCKTCFCGKDQTGTLNNRGSYPNPPRSSPYSPYRKHHFMVLTETKKDYLSISRRNLWNTTKTIFSSSSQ